MQFDPLKRRDFITLLGGTAITLPLPVRAQPAERMRRLGVLVNLAADDPESQARIGAFLQALQEFGWTMGRNIQIDYRYAGGNADRIRQYAAELVSLVPDVILANGNFGVGPLQQVTRTLPIVFVGVTDPVGGGFVASLARPDSNATGFANFEYGLSGKWLELLKEIAPRVTRAGVIRDSAITGDIGQLGAIQSVAPSLGIELNPIGVRDREEIERAITTFARVPNGGLIVVSGAVVIADRDQIITLASRHQLPAVYPFRFFATSGGLISYGPDPLDQYRRAAGYVNRILKGEKPADLPVQAPTKYELVINRKTAKTLGLDVPPALLARADEVIE
jgi:putative tryptophan/tyrosine transport system substrate-binding protein